MYTVGGNGTLAGALGGTSGDGDPALSASIAAVQLALDDSGNIYLSDWQMFTRVRMISRATGIIALLRVAGPLPSG